MLLVDALVRVHEIQRMLAHVGAAPVQPMVEFFSNLRKASCSSHCSPIGRRKKEMIRWRLTTTKQRPPWICTFAAVFPGRLHAAVALPFFLVNFSFKKLCSKNRFPPLAFGSCSIFPKCVARVPVSLGVWGLRVFARRCPTVRNRLQPFAGDRVSPYGRAYGISSAKRVTFGGCACLLLRFVWQAYPK